MSLTRFLSTAALCAPAAPGSGGCPAREDITGGIVPARNGPLFRPGDGKAEPEGFVVVALDLPAATAGGGVLAAITSANMARGSRRDRGPAWIG